MTTSDIVIPVIAGATGTGKTDLALRLASEFPLEIVSADASMVYHGMDIGTAKPSPVERAKVRHHLIDIVQPDESFGVNDYLQRAEQAIEGVLAAGKTPLVVGGTGFYIRALSDGLHDLPEPDPKLQAELWAIVESRGLEPLRQEIRAVSEADFVRVGLNPRRIVRAVEIVRTTGVAPANLPKREPKFKYRKLILWPQWDWLEPRLAQRTQAMFEAGLLQEVQGLLGAFPAMTTALQSIGYKEVVRHLQGEYSLEAAQEEVLKATRAYAKRQFTWFRKETGNPIYVNIESPWEAALELLVSYGRQTF